MLAAALGMWGAIALAGDWLSCGGDPQGTNWQRHGKTLTVANVKNLKLLWKRPLEDHPAESSSLSAPVIMGPTITHRGVRELVFIAGPHDDLYAVDADLGTLFWKRHFDVSPLPERKSPSPCHPGGPATPVIEPDPDEDLSGDPAPVDEDVDDDEAGPMRPLYAVASDGRLHTIRVSDGSDANSPVTFLPPNASYSSLNFWSGTVYAGSMDDCGRSSHGLWSMDVRNSNARPEFVSAEARYGIVIGPTGRVYGTVRNGMAINYQGRQLIAGQAPDGRLVLLDAGSLAVVAGYRPHDVTSGLASWLDTKGVRWIYAATSRDVQALKLSGPSSAPELGLAWKFSNVVRPGPPVITNGTVFLLSGDPGAGAGHNTLKALDAVTGKELYSSEPAIMSLPDAPHLAVANGHICFATDNALSCFGIPLER